MFASFNAFAREVIVMFFDFISTSTCVFFNTSGVVLVLLFEIIAFFEMILEAIRDAGMVFSGFE